MKMFCFFECLAYPNYHVEAVHNWPGHAESNDQKHRTQQGKSENSDACNERYLLADPRSANERLFGKFPSIGVVDSRLIGFPLIGIDRIANFRASKSRRNPRDCENDSENAKDQQGALKFEIFGLNLKKFEI